MNVTELICDKKKILVVDNFITEKESARLQIIGQLGGVQRLGLTQYKDARTSHFASVIEIDKFQNLKIFSDVSEFIKKKFKGHQYFCKSIVYREMVYGDFFDYHQDLSRKDRKGITVVIYLNDEWSREFQGETKFLGPNNTGHIILPIPKRAIFFDSSLVHSSGAPSRVCFESRKIMVFRFDSK